MTTPGQSMTPRERLTAVLRGGKADRVPWTIYHWLLPKAPAGKRMVERGLIPIDSVALFDFHHVEVKTETKVARLANGEQTVTRFRTPLGDLVQVTESDPVSGSFWARDYAVKSVQDLPILKFIYDHTVIKPNYEAWTAADQAMGDSGIVLGYLWPIPIQQLLLSDMGVETWGEAVLQQSEAFEELLESVTVCYRRQIELAANGPAEFIWFPDNISARVMSPALFERYCEPIYREAVALLRQAGKVPFAHYDGANRALKDRIAATDLPVLEALTPPPLGDMTVAECRAAWPDKVLSFNFPADLFQASAEEIERQTRRFLEEGGRAGRFALGCTEEYPADQWEKTFTAMGKAMAEFEGIAWR